MAEINTIADIPQSVVDAYTDWIPDSNAIARGTRESKQSASETFIRYAQACQSNSLPIEATTAILAENLN